MSALLVDRPAGVGGDLGMQTVSGSVSLLARPADDLRTQQS